MNKTVVRIVILVVVLLFAYFVWPTPYRYHRVELAKGWLDGTVVRENRITGTLEIMWRDPDDAGTLRMIWLDE